MSKVLVIVGLLAAVATAEHDKFRSLFDEFSDDVYNRTRMMKEAVP